MRTAIPKNRAEPENLEFSFLKAKGRPSAYILVELWASQEALKWHMEQNYTLEVFGELERSMAYPLAQVDQHLQFVQKVMVVA